MASRAAVRAGRPRSLERDRDLLTAARSLLAEVGYERMTLEAVASRCGAGRTTVYRRWPGKEQLVADALSGLRWDGPVPDTGDLRSDLLALAEAWSGEDAERDAVVCGLVSAMAHDDELQTLVEEVVGRPRSVAFREIVERAVERGDVARPRSWTLVEAVVPALAFHRLALQSRPVDRTFITSVIDEVLLPLLTRTQTPDADASVPTP